MAGKPGKTKDRVFQVVDERPFARIYVRLVQYGIMRNQTLQKLLQVRDLIYGFSRQVAEEDGSPKRERDCDKLVGDVL